MSVSRGQAWFGLSILTFINLLNYLDRYIIAGVMAKVEGAFGLSHAEGGMLGTVFMIVYLCASPIGGFLGDRMPRRLLIGAAVIVWSLATIGSGLAASFALLLIARAMTGIGEAGYGTIAPAFIADLFKKEARSRMLSLFYTAIPLGAAAGFILGGWVGDRWGWHAAFFVGGTPGLVLGTMAFFLPEPVRGGMDDEPARKIPFLEGLKALGKNRRFWVVVAGQTLMNFSIGGLAYWMPDFLEKERGFSGTSAGLALGASTVLGGFLGTIVGGFLGDKLEQRKPGASIVLSGAGLVLAAPLMVAAVLVRSPEALFFFLVTAQFAIFLNNGPLNAAIVNVIDPSFRAFAFGLSMMILHLFGDAASPAAVGMISDHSNLGVAIMLNAVPVLLGGVLLLAGARAFASRPQAVSS